MKRLLFLALVSLFFHAAPCMGNNTLVLEDAKWNIFRKLFVGGTSVKWTESVIIRHDTIINNVLYKNVYLNSSKNEIDTTQIGHIREDSTGKVFIRSIKIDEEFLLYDFGLKQGDSTKLIYWSLLFNATSNPSTYANISVRMDSIEPILLNGVNRLKYHISTKNESYPYWYETDTWISGIGDLQGILYSCVDPGRTGIPGNQLLCLSLSDNLIYMNPTYNTCSMTNVVDINGPETKEIVYFDQASNTLKIDNEQGNLLQMDIINLFGRILLTKRSCENSTEVNLQNLHKGIYFAKVLGFRKAHYFLFNIN